MLDFILGAHTLQSVDKSQVKPGNSQTRNTDKKSNSNQTQQKEDL